MEFTEFTFAPFRSLFTYFGSWSVFPHCGNVTLFVIFVAPPPCFHAVSLLFCLSFLGQGLSITSVKDLREGDFFQRQTPKRRQSTYQFFFSQLRQCIFLSDIQIRHVSHFLYINCHICVPLFILAWLVSFRHLPCLKAPSWLFIKSSCGIFYHLHFFSKTIFFLFVYIVNTPDALSFHFPFLKHDLQFYLTLLFCCSIFCCCL